MLEFSVHQEAFCAERSPRSDEFGYIANQEPLANIVPAIRRVLADQAYLSERNARPIAEKRLRAGRTVTLAAAR